jgi:hypothetical protein
LSIIQTALKFERELFKFRYIIGLIVIILLLASVIGLKKFNDFQEKIAENCGFTDGDIQCTCIKEGFDYAANAPMKKFNISLNNTINKINEIPLS